MIKQSVDFILEKGEVDLVIFAGKSEDVDERAYFKMGCRSVNILRLNGPLHVIFNLFFRKGCSAQEALYFSSSKAERIKKLCDETPPRIVVADMQRTGVFLPYIEALRRILDLDDLLSRRYEQMIVRDSNESILGAFGDRLPRFFASFLNKFGTWVLSREANLLRQAELSAAKKYDAVLLTSSIEVNYLKSLVGLDKIFANSPAIDSLDFPVSVSQPILAEKKISALFVGNFKTAQNIASMEYLCTRVFPVIQGKGYSISVAAVGYADQDVRNRFKEFPVDFLGFVDDWTAVAARCSIALLPVPFGTGIKTKVLDCMAIGIPVFTNSTGAEGIDAVHGDDFFVFDDDEALCDAIISACSNFEWIRRVGHNGYLFVNRVHSREVVSSRLRSAVFGEA
ncbi:glycosyltransferase [Aquabacterium sp.]|uniref:glycosyltransferase n=1 Tax=Aquabacterium sp. TaxID=1872578 RepID=UPI0025C1C560|nr:glycosyltransferase [Aquabacterium sp.]